MYPSTLKLVVSTHLQDEDEIIHRFVPVEEVVLWCPLVLIIVF